jgi:hypothetical protein
MKRMPDSQKNCGKRNCIASTPRGSTPQQSYTLKAPGETRLARYFDNIGELLGRRGRRESFAMYAMGLLGLHSTLKVRCSIPYSAYYLGQTVTVSEKI